MPPLHLFGDAGLFCSFSLWCQPALVAERRKSMQATELFGEQVKQVASNGASTRFLLPPERPHNHLQQQFPGTSSVPFHEAPLDPQGERLALQARKKHRIERGQWTSLYLSL